MYSRKYSVKMMCKIYTVKETTNDANPKKDFGIGTPSSPIIIVVIQIYFM